MVTSQRARSTSAHIRERLDHPVIDGDGHWLEPVPVFLEFLRDVGGPKAVDEFRGIVGGFLGGWYELAPDDRLATRRTRAPWWGEAGAGNTLDRATAMFPNLMCERLDDFGIDFALIYPTMGAFGVLLPDDDMRRAIARAENMMAAELFAPYRDRMTPAATIPTVTPEEAIEETEFAVTQLGMKAIMIAGNVRRPIPALAADNGDPSKVPFFVDSLALDSLYDYDPFWEKCVELGVAVTDHGGSQGWPDRQSPTNFVYNHIGHFAAAHHAFCKALVIGGVPSRFPGLKFCFLEGGIGYGANLYFDLVGHWERRNKQAMLDHLRPDNLDLDRFKELFEAYAHPRMKGHYEELLENLSPFYPSTSLAELTDREPHIDEFGSSGITGAEDIGPIFRQNFYFGCEADDPTVAWAFDEHTERYLNPVFSSDVGHFDVTDMSQVLHEAYELVDLGRISPEQFEQFAFTNIAEVHTSMNPAFFDGTAVEDAVKGLL